MNEIDRLVKQFKDLYKGNPWIDVNMKKTLKELSARKASRKPKPGMNSAWEIVNHLIRWRGVVIKRLQVKRNPSPAHNFFVPVKNKSEKAWENTLREYKKSQKQWLRFIRSYKAKDLSKPSGSASYSRYDILIGILEHDAYHLGQIRLVMRLL